MGGWDNYDSWLMSEPDGVEEFEDFADRYFSSDQFWTDARRWAKNNPHEFAKFSREEIDDALIADEYSMSEAHRDAVNELIEEHRQFKADAILDEEGY